MRFCQSDGTPLVDEAPAIDPYKTMVSSSRDIADSIPAAVTPPVEEPQEKDQEVLELPPDRDPKKTMIVSEEEIRREMATHDEPVVDLPLAAPESPRSPEPRPEPPSFTEPPATAPPPSPFSARSDDQAPDAASEQPFNVTTPPIPSPFESPKPSAIEAPSAAFDPRPMAEPPPSPSGGLSAGIDAAPVEAAPMQYSPPPVQNWESNEPMQNQQFTPQSSAAAPNQTLAIVSLVLGVLSIICCGFLAGVPAVIVGFMARSKATSSPAEYGGAGLALGGIITGIIGTILGIILLIVNIALGGLGAIPSF